MKKKELNKLTKAQAIKNIDKMKKDLFNLRFQKINSQVTNPAKFNETKKTIARLKTLLKGKLNASKITSDWYSWIHHISNDIPFENQKKFFWQKSHKDNKTGTKDSFKPNKISKNSKKFKKYESWKP